MFLHLWVHLALCAFKTHFSHFHYSLFNFPTNNIQMHTSQVNSVCLFFHDLHNFHHVKAPFVMQMDGITFLITASLFVLVK